jgi:PleD family two-component response regulator
LDGKVTEEEESDLAGMREWFDITIEQHRQMEREVKIEAYREALYLARRDKGLSEMEQKTLSMMRQKFAISPEEQAEAEGKFYEETKGSSKTRGTILIVDGDKDMLMSLGGMLKQQGYDLLLSHRVEEAYKILLNQTPDLIISEIYFMISDIDGITFFKKMKEHATLKRRPFIFISSLTDKKLVQAILRLGADHYLPKPLNTELLLAIVDGRLRMSL